MNFVVEDSIKMYVFNVEIFRVVIVVVVIVIYMYDKIEYN